MSRPVVSDVISSSESVILFPGVSDVISGSE